jgi:adenosylcobinamide kinase/adenosylcobinamide-phosphate guanylyltransferase
MIQLVTGGARSGKSRYAEKLANRSEHVTYIATALPIDDAMVDRIKHHQQSRPQTWKTLERDRDFHLVRDQEVWQSARLFLLDCVTIMVTNHMMDAGLDYDACTMDEINQLETRILAQIKELLDQAVMDQKDLVIVTNEVGLGLVPSYLLGNYFRDIAGRVNQYIAERADEVYLCVSGIPVCIKGDQVHVC